MNQAPYQPTFVIVRYVWPMIREAESNFPWLECYLKLSLRHNILTLSASEYQFLTVRQLILSLLSRFRLLWVNITEISQPFQWSISIKLISLQLLFPNQHEIGAALFFMCESLSALLTSFLLSKNICQDWFLCTWFVTLHLLMKRAFMISQSPSSFSLFSQQYVHLSFSCLLFLDGSEH